MDFEKETLRHWSACGYNVPAIMDNPFSELSGFPVLTTKYIEGMTIRDFVRSEKAGAAEKEKKMASIFRDTGERHNVALRSGDNRLFHIDANTRNIMLAEDRIFHCDFEMGRPWESAVECASREVLKLLVSLIEDMGPSFLECVCRTFKNAYKEQSVYACIEKGIAGRPFQAVHRYLNRRKKNRNPLKVTLYDILRCLS